MPTPRPQPLPTHWLFFSFFLLNLLLAYGLDFGPWTCVIGLSGAALLLFWGWRSVPADTGLRDFRVPAWILGAILILALAIRSYRLTSLSVWPNYDDGLWGFFAIRFIHHWDWHPFYEDNSYPSTYAWGLAGLFKLFGPSLFWVWAYPALISAATVPMAYLAARQFFSRSISFFVLLFFAFGFWPVFIGRFGNQQGLTLLFECLWLWSLGRYAAALRSPDPRWGRGIELGVVTALGFYLYISWVAIAFYGFLAVGALLGTGGKRGRSAALLFLGAFLLTLAPIALSGLVHNYGRIVHDIGSLKGDVPLSERLGTLGGFLSVLFWRMPPGRFSYQPVWGGLLDPVLGALFFLGLPGLLREWKKPVSLGVLGGLVLFFIPGILTHDVEPFRNLPMIPFLAAVCGLGAQHLLANFSKRPWLILGVITFIFGALDFYHLAVRYPRSWEDTSTWKGYAKPIERYRAFQVLEPLAASQGPGLIFSNFAPGLCDQTLSVADHSFNAAENPDLSWERSRWTALLINANYRPFLKKRFPEGKAYFLSKGMEDTDGGQMLWVFPVGPKELHDMGRWKKANDAFCCFPGRYTRILRDNLAASYPVFQGDPLLESCFWEKLSDLDFRVGEFKDFQLPAHDLEKGLEKGYPSANVHEKLGVLDLLSSKKAQARRHFELATAAPLDLTQAKQMLRTLEVTPSGGP